MKSRQNTSTFFKNPCESLEGIKRSVKNEQIIHKSRYIYRTNNRHIHEELDKTIKSLNNNTDTKSIRDEDARHNNRETLQTILALF